MGGFVVSVCIDCCGLVDCCLLVVAWVCFRCLPLAFCSSGFGCGFYCLLMCLIWWVVLIGFFCGSGFRLGLDLGGVFVAMLAVVCGWVVVWCFVDDCIVMLFIICFSFW